jgi:hypothetical protein
VDRRRFLLTSLAGALAAPRGADAQQPTKIARIGDLTTADVATAPTTCERPSSKDCVTSVTSRVATS